MTPAAAYLRVSGISQIDGDGFIRQEEAIQACAKAQGYEVIHVYREEAVPGKLDEEHRPAFQEMIATLLGNGCRTIIVESMDRLAREYRTQEQLIIYIASKQIALIAANTGENITEAMMGDPMRRALVQIQGIFAELDKNLIVAKLRKARERKRTKGERCEGKKPFGHFEAERPILDLILRLSGEGCCADSIVPTLNTMGAFTRSGKPWRGSTIRKILRNEKANAHHVS